MREQVDLTKALQDGALQLMDGYVQNQIAEVEAYCRQNGFAPESVEGKPVSSNAYGLPSQAKEEYVITIKLKKV